MTERHSEEAVRFATVGGLTDSRLTLACGRARKPFSVGAAGDWIVRGSGVQDLHAHFAFNGRDLFVAPARSSAAVLLRGKPLDSGRWTRIGVPGEIVLGRTRVTMRRSTLEAPLEEDLQATISGAEKTLVDGTFAVQARLGTRPSSDSPLSMVETMRAKWKRTSAIAAVGVAILSCALASFRHPGRAKTSSAPIAESKRTLQLMEHPTRLVTTDPSGDTPATRAVTLERQAADCVIDGSFDQAAQIYDELTASHPDEVVFRDAARLSRLRMKRNPNR